MSKTMSIPTDEFSTVWRNYGDVNPDKHGGRFIKFNPENKKWKIVETNRCDQVMPDGSDDYQVVTMAKFGFDDVWVDGEPENGFTENMERIFESLGEENHLQDPLNPDFINRAEYYIVDLTNHIGGMFATNIEASTYEYDDYDELIESFGVESYE